MIRHLPISTLFPYTTLFRSISIYSPLNSRREYSLFLHKKALLHKNLEWNPSWIEQYHLSRYFSAALIASTLSNSPSELTPRSEEHTSELQSHSDLVCRLLLE